MKQRGSHTDDDGAMAVPYGIPEGHAHFHDHGRLGYHAHWHTHNDPQAGGTSEQRHAHSNLDSPPPALKRLGAPTR